MSRVRAVERLAPLADEDVERVRDFLAEHHHGTLVVELVAEDGARAVLPTNISEATGRFLAAVTEGRQVDFTAPVEEFTPNEAADLLRISRTTVSKLMAEGALPFRTLPGSAHRRLPREDVLAFRDRRASLEAALAEAAELAIEEGSWDAPAPRRTPRGRRAR